MRRLGGLVLAALGSTLAVVAACGDDASSSGPGASSGQSGASSSGTGAPEDGGPTVPPPASCASAGGAATVSAPVLVKKLTDEGGEGWLASPAIADLDGDGKNEVVAVRGARRRTASSGRRAARTTSATPGSADSIVG